MPDDGRYDLEAFAGKLVALGLGRLVMGVVRPLRNKRGEELLTVVADGSGALAGFHECGGMGGKGEGSTAAESANNVLRAAEEAELLVGGSRVGDPAGGREEGGEEIRPGGEEVEARDICDKEGELLAYALARLKR